MGQETATVKAFAPATIGNVGPGFDVLGLAIDGAGDTVVARLSNTPGVTLAHIHGDGGKLPRDATANPAGIAAVATLRKAGIDAGVELELHKGLPIGSGLGSSAASAAAAAFAVNVLVGSPLRKSELIGPCLDAEAAVSARHADNVAPAILGGLVLVRAVEPLEVVRLPVPADVTVVVAVPRFELPTRVARQALPAQVSLASRVQNAADIASFVAACYANDLGLLSRCLRDDVVNGARTPLIPGGAEVIAAAIDAGALGSSISGAGPSIFALCRSPRSALEVGAAMVSAFERAGLEASTLVSPADCPGVRLL